MKYSIGIDIGSTTTKTAVLNEKNEIVKTILMPTGYSSVETAENVKKELQENGYLSGEYHIVATGYGRVAVPYADKCITEITCHAKGAVYLHQAQNLTVIDIGGQDTKVIRVENGMVTDFLMNDKCSAGTGRFLEIMANTLAVKPGELCELAAKGSDTKISSLCTVFAESEVVSLVGRGESRENIAFAVIDSVVRKVTDQARKLVTKENKVCLTGGLCEMTYIADALGNSLNTNLEAIPEGRYAGAIGAALAASSISGR